MSIDLSALSNPPVPQPAPPDVPAAPPDLEKLPLSPEPQPDEPLEMATPRFEPGPEHGTTWAPHYGRVFEDGPSPYDIRQNGIGDCYLLASLAAIAQTRPDIIEGMISRAVTKPYQSYVVQFPHDHHPVRVSNMFPTAITRYRTEEGSAAGVGSPMYGSSPDPDELWVALLEKAFAVRFGKEIGREVRHAARARHSLGEWWKLRGAEGYRGIGHGYWAAQALEMLTGGKSYSYSLPKDGRDRGQSYLNGSALVKLLEDATQQHWPVVFSTGSALQNPKKFLGPHAYAFLLVGPGTGTAGAIITLYESNTASKVDATLREIIDNFDNVSCVVPPAS